MMKKRPLGRNLDVLLSRNPQKIAAEAAESAAPVGGELRQLPLDVLQRGRYQPRKEIHQEAIMELAESIRTQGVLQPIVVRAIAPGKYEIIAGERRWRAAQLAELKEIPVLIKDISDENALAIALIENIQRENLNPLEEAIALQRLIDEFGMTHQQVAEAVGKSRTTITNLLRLLSLPNEVKRLMEERALEMGHARALLSLDSAVQIEVARLIVAQGLSVRATEKLVASRQNAAQVKFPHTASAQTLSPDIRALQKELSDRLGAPVVFRHSASGKGKLQIQYNSLDELDGILARIQ